MKRTTRTWLVATLVAAVAVVIVVPMSLAKVSASASQRGATTLSILMLGGNETSLEPSSERVREEVPADQGSDRARAWAELPDEVERLHRSALGPAVVTIQSGAIFLPYKQALQPLPELKSQLKHYTGAQNFCDNYNCNKAIYEHP